MESTGRPRSVEIGIGRECRYLQLSHIPAFWREQGAALVHMPQSIYDQIRRHGEVAYPYECCGILLGQFNDGTVTTHTVSHAVPVPNASATPARHYEIGSKDLILVMREARAAGCEIVGFYHSHPDHPAQPSATDLREAHWLGCSYVITAVIQGRATATRAFLLTGKSEEDKGFAEEELCPAELSD